MDKVRYKIKDLRYNTTNNKHQVGGKLHDDIMVVVKYIMKGMYDSTKESVLADLSKYSDITIDNFYEEWYKYDIAILITPLDFHSYILLIYFCIYFCRSFFDHEFLILFFENNILNKFSLSFLTINITIVNYHTYLNRL